MAATDSADSASADRSARPPAPRKATKRSTKAQPVKAQTASRRRSEPPVSTGTTVATVRLPLFTATITKNGAPSGRTSAPGADVSRSDLQMRRLAFYGGAAALGVLEVIEWPVALLVAAGMYVAGRSRENAVAAAVSAGPRADAIAEEPSD